VGGSGGGGGAAAVAHGHGADALVDDHTGVVQVPGDLAVLQVGLGLGLGLDVCWVC